jgi:hypothetical protein
MDRSGRTGLCVDGLHAAEHGSRRRNRRRRPPRPLLGASGVSEAAGAAPAYYPRVAGTVRCGRRQVRNRAERRKPAAIPAYRRTQRGPSRTYLPYARHVATSVVTLRDDLAASIGAWVLSRDFAADRRLGVPYRAWQAGRDAARPGTGLFRHLSLSRPDLPAIERRQGAHSGHRAWPINGARRSTSRSAQLTMSSARSRTGPR